MPDGFFGGATQEGVGLSGTDIQTITQAKDDAQTAATASQLAMVTAQSAQAAAQTAASDAQTAVATVAVSATAAATSATAAATSATAAATSEANSATYSTAANSSSGDAGTSATEAAASAVSAQAWASSPLGQVVDAIAAPGLESSYSYSQRAAAVSAASRALPARDLLDADFTSNNYTLQARDLGYLLRSKKTTNGHIILPQGLYTGPGPTADHSHAVVHVLLRGAGTMGFTAGTGAVIAPSRLTDQSFVYTVTTALASLTPTHSVVVPAGTGRVMTVMLFALFNTDPVTPRTIGMGITNTVAVTKTVAETGNGFITHASQGPLGAVWKATIADGAAVTCVISPTFDNCLSYVLWAFVAGNVASTTGAAGSTAASGGTTDVSITLTPSEASDMPLFGMSQISTNAVFTVGGGVTPVVAQTGVTGTRTGKDLGYAFGYEVLAGTGAQTYTGTTPVGTNVTKLGTIMQPGTASTVTLNGAPGTLSTTGQQAVILIEDDGATYDVRAL